MRKVILILIISGVFASCKSEEEKLEEKVNECWGVQKLVDEELKEFTNEFGMIEPETRFALYQQSEEEIKLFEVEVVNTFKRERYSRDSVNDVLAHAKYNEYLRIEAEKEKKRIDAISFEIHFGNEIYRVNKKRWMNFKVENEEFDIQASKSLRSVMGENKAIALSNSLYRTLSSGISREGLTMKAVQGIQLYDIMRTGEVKFY